MKAASKAIKKQIIIVTGIVLRPFADLIILYRVAKHEFVTVLSSA